MPGWLVAALAAPALWAIVAVIDHNMINKVYPSARFATVVSGIFASLPALLAFSHHNLSVSSMFVAMLAGAVFIIQYFSYFKAMEVETPSKVLALYNLSAIFIPILAFLFLNERLNQLQFIGFGLIIISSLLLTLQNIRKLTFSKGLRLMIISTFYYSISVILMKYVYEQSGFLDGYAFFSIGQLAGAIFLAFIPTSKENFVHEVKNLPVSVFFIAAVTEALNIVALFIENIAINGGPVSLVAVIESLEPVFVLIIAVLLYPILPRFLPEALEGKKILKLSLMVLMLIGIFIIERSIT